MPSLANIATSSLSAYKVALQTVGNNIANVNTEGYSRQMVNLATQTSQQVGTGFIGGGVVVSDIERLNSFFNTRLMQESKSDFSRHEAFYQRSVVIDKLFAQEGTDVAENLQSLFTALEQANESPSSIPARNVFMEQASFVADQFQNIQSILDESQSNLNQQLQDMARDMTSIAKNIALINADVQAGVNAPELLDERDKLVLELASYMNVQTNTESDGSMNVMIGKGESIVIGSLASTVTVGTDPDTGTSTLDLSTSGNQREITRNIAGGKIQGLVEYEEDVLREVSRQLGLLGIVYAENFNNQNQLGMDLNNDIGGNIFTDFNSTPLQTQRSIANSNNTSNAFISVEIADPNQLVNSDYSLTMTGLLAGTLTRESDGSQFAITFAAPGAPPPTIEIATVNGNAANSIDGFTLDFTNAPAVNDIFTISPTRNMSGNMQLLTEEPADLALASPVRAFPSANNQSNGTIKIGTVSTTDTTATNVPDLTDRFEIRILQLNPAANSDFSYEIVNTTDNVTLAGGPFNGSFGTEIAVRDDAADTGYGVVISGSVQVGDVYVSEYNTNGRGDNTNGLLLADLQNRNLIANSSETLIDRFSHMVADVGTATYQANVRMQSAEVLFNQAEAEKLSVVGVNLDEEAANLLALQQAYQATGQLIATSKQMFDVIFAVLS